MPSLEKIREDFPILKREINGHPLVYFDNAATTQRPKEVMEAEWDFVALHNANIHRGIYTLSEEASDLYEKSHEKVAQFIGATSWREIVFTRNTTEAINLVARSWGEKNLRRGDEVILTVMEHHSNIVPWQLLKEKLGIVLNFVDIKSDGTLNLEDYENLLSERTRLLSLLHVSNVLGTVNPVGVMVEKAKEVGALTFIDAAQSVPHLPVNVTELGCDFLAASAHKMLGPWGIGFLYGREDLLEEMDPFLSGGDMIQKVTLRKTTWNELPWKFEAGTPNVSGAIGLMKAIEYLERIGMNEVYNHERELLKFALRGLKEVRGIALYGPLEEERVAVIPFNLDGVDPRKTSHYLDRFGIQTRSGCHCAQPLHCRLGVEEGTTRMSFYIYNTKEEIEKTLEILKKTSRDLP